MIPVRDLSIPDVLQIHCAMTPSAIAVVANGRTVTWGELIGRANQIANGLRRLGLNQGDRVAILFDNSIELLELLLGTMISGGVVVPLSGLMTSDVARRMITSAGVRFAFIQDRFVEKFPDGVGLPDEHCFATPGPPGWADRESWIAVQSRDRPRLDYPPASSISILYTSGTTGMPKGMEHSHFSRLLYPLVLGPLLRIERSSVAILATPMYHNGTWTTMLPTLYAGGTVVIAEKFVPTEFQSVVARERCTHVFMVPTQLIMLAAEPQFDPLSLASLKTIMVSGSHLPPETLKAMRVNLPNTEICEIYGMGEGFMTFASDRNGTTIAPGSVGRPIAEAGTVIQIIDDDDKILPAGQIGEIVGTSSFMLKGYFREPEVTRQSLWFDEESRAYLRSGDLGYYDDQGFLHLAGRKKDMINSGGVKVYATDLEEIFMQHPGVLEVAAIAIPHPKWGETPLLLAIMKPAAKVSEVELREWGNARLAKAQRVSRVEFRASFPRNALDKVVKRHLREPYWRS